MEAEESVGSLPAAYFAEVVWQFWNFGLPCIGNSICSSIFGARQDSSTWCITVIEAFLVKWDSENRSCWFAFVFVLGGKVVLTVVQLLWRPIPLLMCLQKDIWCMRVLMCTGLEMKIEPWNTSMRATWVWWSCWAEGVWTVFVSAEVTCRAPIGLTNVCKDASLSSEDRHPVLTEDRECLSGNAKTVSMPLPRATQWLSVMELTASVGEGKAIDVIYWDFHKASEHPSL